MSLAADLAALPGRCGHGYAGPQHPALCDCTTAVSLKIRGIRATNDASAQEVKDRVDAAIRRLAATGREFSANDMRADLAGITGPIVGGRFNAAASAGLIKKSGNRVRSNLASTHSHELLCWIGVTQ